VSRLTYRCLPLTALLAAPLLAPPGPSRSAPAPVNKPRNLTNSLGMKFVRIPAGKFLMGSPPDEVTYNAQEGPRHEVEITRPFYLGIYEVTQAQYKKVTGTNPSHFSATGSHSALVRGMDTSDFPVDNITSAMADEFCKKLSALHREKGARRVYRLPTEAQWEYACRAGAKKHTVFYHGNTITPRDANFLRTLGRTCKVGSYKPNAWGLYDMHGNVWEWVADFYDRNYYGKSPKQDPKGPAGTAAGTWRIARGGAWFNTPTPYLRTAYRAGLTPETNGDYVGFRVACDIGGR
jgi:formylglycine-generating enzyme required for sulfatase activity